MTLIDKAEALAVLQKAQIASCNCQIKTPDPEWHSHNCRYRILREAEAMIDHLPDAALPARGVGADAVLDAAHAYLVQQYGHSALAHPIDRARILAALELAPPPTDAAYLNGPAEAVTMSSTIQPCTWPTCGCTAKGQFCEAPVRWSPQHASRAMEGRNG